MKFSGAILLLLVVAQVIGAEPAVRAATWKAGIAKANITPEKPLWLAGYGSRDHPAEGKLHDIWIKALALEDGRGFRVILLTTDLCGMPKWMNDSVCEKVRQQHGLGREQIRITNSHNHCAPAVRGELEDYYGWNDQQRQETYEYSDWLEGQIVATIAAALAKMEPVKLAAGDGQCTFAVNRRNNREAEVPDILARGEKLKGPVDHSVPVLSVSSLDDKLVAVVFAYACHNTTLSFYQWCGDYAGFAQIALERAHPGAQALFVDGCGGDQNPLPRRTVELCEKYGKELADGVEKVLNGPMRPLAPEIHAAFESIELAYDKNPTRAELDEALRGPNVIRARWAKRMLAHLDSGKSFDKSRPYAVQAWQLGDQTWIALGGEGLIDYALRFKAEFGSRTWVTSYFADMTAYIPSRRNWHEGGYEVAYLYEYMLPADRWAVDVEDRIAAAVTRLVHQVRRQTRVSVQGESFQINGQPTYAGQQWHGHKIEGLLFNSRMVQGIFDDLNPVTASQWAYADTGKWDAGRNTREFVEAMSEWRQHGLLALTINLQGGSPHGYSRDQPWYNSAIRDDGSLRTEYLARLERIVDRADELGMVVILGIFYFGQDQRLQDEAAIHRAVDATVDWVFDHGYENVLIEINNECNVRYDHAALQPERVHELIERVQARTRNGRRLLVSTSYGGGVIPERNVVRTADFLLLHGNGVEEPERMKNMVRETRQRAAGHTRPILVNEDDHDGFDGPQNNFTAAVGEYASWGFFDYRRAKEGFDEGYQSVPVNWKISSDRKRGFFKLLAEITGSNSAP